MLLFSKRSRRFVWEAHGLLVIDHPTVGAFDLEFAGNTGFGQHSITVTAPDLFQHLQDPFTFGNLGPALASVGGLGWLAAAPACWRPTQVLPHLKSVASLG